MASTSRDQALYEMSQILRGDAEARRKLGGYVLRNVVGLNISNTWRYNPSRDMVCIEFSNPYRLKDRLEYAMLRKIVGLGPQRYCIVYQEEYLFSLRLAIVMTYLPRQKMFLYPAGTNFTRHFS